MGPIIVTSIGFSTAAFGALMMAGGALFESRARRRITELESHSPGDEAQSLIDEYGNASRTRNTVGIVLGGALVFTGFTAAFIGLDRLRGKRGLLGSDQSVRLTPSLSRSHVGLSLFRRF